MSPNKYKLLDSHVHLCPKAYTTDYLPGVEPGHLLDRNLTMKEYVWYNNHAKFDKEGIVVIEMAVTSSPDKNDQETGGWANPLKEFKYHCDIIDDKLVNDEDAQKQQQPGDGDFIKGLIPWCPVPAGKEAVEEYLAQLQSIASEKAFARVKGFRYVLQDKPPKTGTDPKFLEGLEVLSQKGYVFDIGIDLQDGGFYQFQECYEIFSKLPKMKFVINHLTKPDFKLNHPNEEFNEWIYYMKKISRLNNSYMKLSGCFEKMPPKYVLEHNITELALEVSEWFKVILELYGTKRIIFGSNWPMDNTNNPDKFDEEAFNKWGLVVELLLTQNGLDHTAKEHIFYNNCISAYNLDI